MRPVSPDEVARDTSPAGANAAALPRDGRGDSTLAFLAEGRAFIGNRCRRLGSDVFQTRLFLRPTICMTGAEAAGVFCDDSLFTRTSAAAPGRVLETLFGTGGVQGLDEQAHRSRNQMPRSLVTRERVADLVLLAAEEWRKCLGRWQWRSSIVLLDEVERIFCRAACRWTGVPLAEPDVVRRTDELAAVATIDWPAAVGPRRWRARAARWSAARWLTDVVALVRRDELDAPPGSGLRVIAEHRDREVGLGSRAAAVELLDILCSTVAVARLAVFAALALHQHPVLRDRLRAGRDDDLEMFAHEVLRCHPLFPVVAARVRREFVWAGARFPRGARALLDLHGTSHDPRSWERPEEFWPQRFRGRRLDEPWFIPQGGGLAGVRPGPGERIAIELTRLSLRMLTRAMSYRVPPQDLRLSRSRMPTAPRSRFAISGLRARPHAQPSAADVRARMSR